MPVTRNFVQSLPKGSPQRQHYEIVLKDMLSTDVLTKKLFHKTSIILTSHPGNRPFLRASVESHKKIGYFLLLSYDNYWNPKQKNIGYNGLMPDRNVFDLADLFLISSYREWPGLMLPYFFQLYHGIMTLGNFDYVFCSNGDCVIEKPEGFPKLLKIFEESGADIFPCGYEKNHGRPLFNTTSFLGRTKSVQSIMKHFRNHFVPVSTYEKYAEEYGNTESRFAKACCDLNLKVLKPEKNPVNTQITKCSGTWGEILGFRHIHAEFNTAYRKRKIPPHYKFLDSRYMTAKYNMIKQYYEEKNPKKKQQILEKFWASR